MSKLVKVLSVAAPLIFIGSKVVGNRTKNILHDIKINIPLESVKMGFVSLATFFVKASLRVQNHLYTAITIENIHMTVFVKKNDGSLTELASTPPDTKEWIIKENSTTIISDIKINVSNISLIPALQNLMNKPKGERFKIVISGYANSIPFTKDMWY